MALKFSDLSYSEKRDAANEAMLNGGEFAEHIAKAYLIADSRNRSLLEQSFGDLLLKHHSMARLRKEIVTEFRALKQAAH